MCSSYVKQSRKLILGFNLKSRGKLNNGSKYTYKCISNALSEKNRESDLNIVKKLIIMTSCLPPTFTPQNRDEVFIHLLSFIEVVKNYSDLETPSPPGGVMNLKIGSAPAFYEL